jgi:cell division protein FtsW (lipid II flippase)
MFVLACLGVTVLMFLRRSSGGIHMLRAVAGIGLLASGRVNPNAPEALHKAMGVDNWHFVLRSLGAAGMFLLACLGVSLLMLLRRSSGGIHMLRAVAGIGLLAWAPFMVARAGINWTASTDRVVNGWQVWQTVAERVPSELAVRATILLVAGILLLLWPATRKRPATTAAAPAPKTDKPADAPAPTTTPVP